MDPVRQTYQLLLIHVYNFIYEPRNEIDTNPAVQPSRSNHRRYMYLETFIVGYRKQMEFTIYIVCGENKGTDQLICAYVLAYANRRVSHDAAL